MGLLATIGQRLGLTRPSVVASATVEGQVVTPTRGTEGTTNWNGRILAERNAALRDELGYGRAGSQEWGEWEEIRRTNPFVAAGIEFVLAPLGEARLDVEAAEAHPNPALAKAQADFVRWNLELLEMPLRTRAADGMLTAGFSLFEHPWARTPRPEVPGGAFFIPALEERSPSSLSANPWLEDETGRLYAVKQSAPAPGGGGWFYGEMPVEQLLRFTWQQAGRNYQGFSAFRPVWYIAGRVQPELLRLIGVTYQREGAGVPVASAVDPKTPLGVAEREKLHELLANLVYHENASAVLPAGWKLDWIFSPGANKGHVLEAWQQLGTVVLQQVGAQQLALGTGDTGSRSVGEVHDARSLAFVRKVAAVLHAGMAELTKKLVDANWGPQVAYPTAKLTLRRPELDPKTRAEATGIAKAAGVFTPTLKDENQMREELGFSPITEAERAAAPPVVAPPVGPPPFRASHEAECACSACETPTLRAAVAWQPWRPLRASESRTDWTRIDEYLSTRRDAFERQVRPIVVEMLARAAGDITRAMSDGNPSEVAELPLDTSRLDAALEAFLDDVRETGGRMARSELRRDTSEDLAEARRLSAAAEEDDRLADEAEDDADEVLEAQQRALVRRMTSRLRNELEAEALDVLRTGGDAAQVVARVLTRQLETGAFRSDAGAVVTRVFNVGRDEAARIVGGVQTVEYSALLDTRVCEPCRRMDGRRARFGSAEHDAMLPPNRDCDGGANCRCLVVYVPGGDE